MGQATRKEENLMRQKKEQKPKYEEESRKRLFQQKWLNEFAWLQYHKKNDLMTDAVLYRAGMQIIIKNKFIMKLFSCIMKLFSCIKFSVIFFCSELHVSNFVSTLEEISQALHVFEGMALRLLTSVALQRS